VHHLPGDTVRPGEVLFTLKLLSESLHLTQTDLFKATQDIKLAQVERTRLAGLGDSVAGTRVIEKDNEITRLQVAVKAYRQELLNRGFSPDLIDGVTEGKFVNEIAIVVPPRTANATTPSPTASGTGGPPDPPPSFEVQELKVDLGQQVQAGQTLCVLANHQKVAVEGRAFRDETPLLERSVKEKWPVEVDFGEPYPGDRDAAALVARATGLAGGAVGPRAWTAASLLCLGEADGWFPPAQNFVIRHLANTIDPVNRTFAFLVPLENQSRVIEDEGRTQTLWRFRPGQKVRLLVRVEKIDNVFVLPADAVARDGPEAFVFTQNVNTFERKPVRVLLQDRQQVVLANDGSLPPGTYVVQGAAAQLNRLVKAGGSGGVPKGYHIHADGSLHKNEDEGK